MIYTTQYVPQSTSYVFDSYFFSILSYTKGGAVSIEDTKSRLNVSFSSFFNCSSYDKGGSIFSTTKSLYYYSICCIESYSKNQGSLCYSTCTSGNENNISYVSLSHSTNDDMYIAITNYGIEKGDYINSTFNHCAQTSGFMFWHGDEGSTSSYGSLINNSDIRGCTLEYSHGRMDIKNYNLLYNVGTTNHQSPCGFMSTWGGTGGCTLCTFLYNKGSKYMFFSDSGSMEIKDCFYDWRIVNNQYISFNGDSKIYNVINMIHTGYCKAEGEPDINTDASKFYVPGKVPTYFRKKCFKTYSCRKNNICLFFVCNVLL